MHYHYIGIDVSKKELFTFDGKKVRKFPNNPNLIKFDGFLKKRALPVEKTIILFESTGVYSSYLKHYCAENGYKAFVVNPKRSANFVKALGNRSKTDQIDSKALYEFKNVIKPEEASVPFIDEAAEKLNAYLTSYQFIMKLKQATSNHLEALNNSKNAPKKLVSAIKCEHNRLNKLEKKIIDEATNYCKTDSELKEDFENLTSITSIGDISAVALICLFRKYPDTNRAQITALVGMDSTKRESGTSVRGRMKISKNGFAMVRKILYFPTMNAIQNNIHIKPFYDRLIIKHKLPKIALIAAMKKLLLIAHAVYNNKTKYKKDLGVCA